MLLNRNLFKNTRMQNNSGMAAQNAAPWMQPTASMAGGNAGYGFPAGGVKYAQPVVYPTQVNQVNTFETTVVPVVHPQHTQVVNHQMVQMQHYYPQTASCQTQTTCCDQNCGCAR